MLQRFSEDLTALQRAIRWGKGDELFDLFTRTRAIRRGIIEQGQDDAAPDFGRSARLSARARRFERVDRGMDPRLDLGARQARRDRRRRTGSVTMPGALRPLARPQPAAVERDRDHRQLERAIEPRKARRAAAAARRARRACLRERSGSSGPRASAACASRIIWRSALADAVAIDDDDAIAPRRPAPDRNARQLRASSRSPARRASAQARASRTSPDAWRRRARACASGVPSIRVCDAEDSARVAQR